ncbi:sensor histidine kinase [Nonomuraea phyllanthi]|uniref:histidine kinase n=1 Tax=Nonomuraea phyllanthi TaxID=2219224 RepID=A0A5C4WS91_9ACTN|nr:sensor histidine kinase [Nonomuraea phyllanthi]KAB8196516.1 sensor histidine kinase [Nonomuraea phyllanthi]
MTSLRGWPPIVLDGALAVAVTGMLLVTALVDPKAGALDIAAVLIGALSLVAWRRAPLVSLLVSTACMLVYSAHTDPGPPAGFPVMVSVFGAVRAGHRLLPALASAAFLGGGLAAKLATATGQSPQDLVQQTTLLVGWFVASGVMATVARHRQAYVEQAEQRAAEAERTREEAARRRAGEERLRIARELHDSLTHSISIIKVQAGVAVHLARKRGDEVPAALLAIQEASGDAMRELRATLEVLRDSDQPEPGSEPSASGLDRLDDLVERACSTGLSATVTISGVRRQLPPEVDRAAYRIVQEALTNVSRHAGGAAATVRVDYGEEELVVRVDDDGPATRDDPPVPGVGLLGMRERVTALGGRLLAEPRPEGGFTVSARLPVSAEPPAGLPAGLPVGESA